MTLREIPKRITPSFEALLKGRYGGERSPYASIELRAEGLVAGYYGVSSKPKRNCKTAKTQSVVSRSFDDGEVLTNRGERLGFVEYVVEHSPPPASSEAPPARSFSVPAARSVAEPPPRSSTITDECETDIVDPLASSRRVAARSPAPQPPRSPARPAAAPVYDPPSSPSTPASNRTVAPTPPSIPDKAEPGEVSRATASDDDFMNDLQQILTGQKVFDPRAKKTVAREQLDQPSAISESQSGGSGNGSGAIFDRIARSMQYANAYDLGTMELENRFADFDREKDVAKQKPQPRAGTAAAKQRAASEADFQRDLAEIKQQAAYAQSLSPTYSQPFYDTGEHVLTGADQYVDRLHVGAGDGVAFSYGQIIAMGDFYESVDQMMKASVTELSQLKTLIVRSTTHYGSGGPDVSNDEWQRVTHQRYLQLAEKNYDHFSPNFLTYSAAALKAKAYGDNKSAWEAHHRSAIQAMQKLFLDSGNVSVFPEWPLIINAFGDHFLTDAFAAGHLVNKEAIIEIFKSNFFSGGSLTSAGKDFFEKVADKAFVGAVKDKFSDLETADWYRIWGVPIFHPNINSASRFATVLQSVAEKAPEQIGNLAVKAVHDRLNHDGIDVSNGAGDSWRLTGDGTLNKRNLGIIQKAVAQSIANINDSGILADNIDFGTYFDKVWKFVPRLGAANIKTLEALSREYTTPGSSTLVDAAARIIQSQADLLIQKLEDANALRPA